MGAMTIADLVKSFNGRKGAFTAVHVTEGDLGEVAEIKNESQREEAKLTVVLKSGRTFTFNGADRGEWPYHIGDYYFVIDITIPGVFQICDGGCASITGEMSLPSPSEPRLALTLIDAVVSESSRPLQRSAGFEAVVEGFKRRGEEF